MATPTKAPDWAETFITEAGYGENRIEPPQEIKDSGVLGEEPWSRAFLNYQLWHMGQWIKDLNERVTVLEGGTV